MNRLTLLATALALLAITGCKRESSDTLTDAEEQQAANYFTNSETESEVVFNDVFDNVLGVNAEVGFGGTGIFGRSQAVGTNTGDAGTGREMGLDSLPSCVTVTVTRLNLPAPFPVRVSIDFGTAGCTGNDGHVRYGKVITTYTGPLRNPGNSATTGFEGFRIDSIAVSGSHKIENTTALGSNQRQFTVTVTDARLQRPSGNFSQWNSTRVITQVEGNGTLLPQDDIFTITGSARGRVRRDNLLLAWRSEIIEPLRKRFICRWISRGILRTWRETLPSTSPWVATLNYGDGTCDFLATLTINGQSQTIQLPQ